MLLFDCSIAALRTGRAGLRRVPEKWFLSRAVIFYRVSGLNKAHGAHLASLLTAGRIVALST